MNSVDSGQLARRLEWFRSSGGVARVAASSVASADPAALALELGGRVASTTVVIESDHEVAVDRGALARLPFGVDADRPLIAIDTETTGLATAAGTVAFLVGVGTLTNDRLRVQQFLLPDHSAEGGLLTALADVIPADASLVTYNGKSFDWPLLISRYRLHRREPPPLAGHIDLLHIARALWKHRLGNARLSTVEAAICRVRRTDDLPGSLIPDRYFTYLRERQPDLLRDIVDHNRQDVISLMLLLRALTRLADPEAWRTIHPGDIGALGRAYARTGDRDTAIACLDAALGTHGWEFGVTGAAALWRRLAVDRARLLARVGRREDAVDAWQEMAARGGPGAAAAWLHVARHREHVERDVAGALVACQQAYAACERARLWGRPVPAVERDLAWRMARLRRRSVVVRPMADRAA